MVTVHAPERHAATRIGWLRAAVLGANDGIVSTASLVVGVAAAAAGKSEVLVAGVAGLVAGAMSMAAGEYVSVSSQADTEAADIAREKAELAAVPERELDELADIYEKRGLSADLARQVAQALTDKDALAAHTRDELGFAETLMARPLQAAFTSALTFSVGAAMPLLAAFLLPMPQITIGVPVASLLFLMVLGGVGARAGGAPVMRGVIRVTFWGVMAMVATYLIGRAFGTSIS